ncbi:uncharacterized protein LOC133896962 [Phragmites australis]|uniref:uncharacterized protein LOC133896962 n=1 Tax=Phragmites australis TaxID=29695 RepID=UPI002D772447|nr:uncharacterized protein LOC133896962 [Phragmites australis]
MAPGDDARLQREEEERAARAAAEIERTRLDAQRAADMRALAVANAQTGLHAQAVAVQSIKTLVPVDSANYSKWSNLLLNTLGKYALDDHVLSDDSNPDDDTWSQLDCTVKSWLYGTISSDLQELVMHREATARSVWLGLEQQFLGNKETRALYLDAKFRNFVQGALSITDYCRQLKGMADALGDLGEPVPDRTLVLNVLCGLNQKFSYMTALLKRQKPFPLFIEVRSDLLLEELTMANKSSTPSAFVAGTSPASSSSRGGQPSSGSAPNQYSGGSHGNNNKNRRRGDSSGGSNPSVGSNSTSANSSGRPAVRSGWPTVYNPWTGSIQLWSGPSAPHPASGLLGPRPASQPPGHVQQALVAEGHGAMQPAAAPAGMQPLAPGSYNAMHTMQPQASGIPPHFGAWPATQSPLGVPGTPFLGWDQNMLAQSFNTMTLNPPASTEWYLDSGATSHMTSDAVRQFTTDNRCSVEFDPFDVSVKDLLSKNVIARHRPDAIASLYTTRCQHLEPRGLEPDVSSASQPGHTPDV